ncbi:MAG: VTC domain-containing protein [Saprospiraceae bacterium]|nr:VTC domain-containing protein [Saprospiraceae bacterium]
MTPRIELKYAPDQISYAHCVEIIRQHPSSFRKIFPDRWVNNIYFDTPDLASYHANMHGISHRKKYRIRWYGNLWRHIQSPTFEIKEKENQQGIKLSFDMADFSVEHANRQLDRLHINTLPGSLVPVLANRYLRSYWMSMDQRFRFTIDRNLSFGSFLTNFPYPHVDVDMLVAELKYSADLDDRADHVRQYVPFRRTKFSKYVHGLLSVLY